MTRAYEIVDFANIPGVPCPCGSAKRALGDIPDFPGTVHVTEIHEDAKLHYHRRLIETYYFLECDAQAKMQLDDEMIPVHPGLCIMIRPGTRHRAVGRMKVLIVVLPKFDPTDEVLVDDADGSLSAASGTVESPASHVRADERAAGRSSTC